MPRLAFVCSVITDVGGEYTELCPAHIYIIVHYRVHEVGQCVESGDIMTPEGEAGKPEMQTAFQRACHPIP